MTQLSYEYSQIRLLINSIAKFCNFLLLAYGSFKSIVTYITKIFIFKKEEFSNTKVKNMF
jgi:hypothetical protein